MAGALINITGIPRHWMLRGLVSAASPLGFGTWSPDARLTMINEQAEVMVDELKALELRPGAERYYWGRPIKTDLDSVLVNPLGYDRDQGQGAMQRVVDELRRELA